MTHPIRKLEAPRNHFLNFFQVQRHNIVILTGTKNETHMKQDLNILNWELDENELVEMDGLF